MNIEELERLVKNKLDELGFELYSLSTRKERNNLILEIVVDRVEPIDMNAIVMISDELNKLLDENDPFDTPYMLDVSSLGVEKPLTKDNLHLYVGKYIHLHLVNPINGENIYEGVLDEVKDNELTLSYKDKTRTKTIKTGLDNIYKVRLAIKF